MSRSSTATQPRTRTAAASKTPSPAGAKRSTKAPARRGSPAALQAAPLARKARGPRFTAATADRYELYQLAVQSADLDVRFLRKVYREIRGREPRHLREDFCGTALLCAEWVKLDPKKTAEGYDLDPEPLEWGRQRNIEPLGRRAARVELHLADCRRKARRLADVRVVQNFSYWILRERRQLLDYFKKARAGLAPGGIFVLDTYGGTEATVETLEERRIEGGFTYVWDQHAYYPATGEFHCNIHFRFRDGSRLDNAFQYVWRLWGLPETCDLLREAGFSQVDVYFEGSDEDDPDGEGNGVFEKDEKGENCEAWIAYVVAQR
jgi:SAM-dependent methyltransferase